LDLGRPVLLANTRWFVKIRWILAALCALLGLACGLMPQAVRGLVVPPGSWLWTLAGVLALANAFFHVFVGRLKDDAPRRAIEASLWLQIVADLAVITGLVRLVGSTSTLIAFAYLFHIAMACILFPRLKSLLVTLLATPLFLGCVSEDLNGPQRALATAWAKGDVIACAFQNSLGWRLLLGLAKERGFSEGHQGGGEEAALDAVVEKAVISDTVKPGGEDVIEESLEKFMGVEGYLLLNAALFAVDVGNGDGGLAELPDAGVADGDAVRVPRKVDGDYVPAVVAPVEMAAQSGRAALGDVVKDSFLVGGQAGAALEGCSVHTEDIVNRQARRRGRPSP
jgi:hypothetical protein